MDELSPNSTVSHYRILSKPGAEGMGEVSLIRVKVNPFPDPLRDDPQFNQLVKQLALD